MPADLEKARELFLHAVGKLPADEWERYVAEACGGDAELRRQAERLLRVHREAGSFLERPAPALWDIPGTPPDGPAGEMTTDWTGTGPGTTIGPYKLVEEIGEGGFGIVFMAEQQRPVRRKVALKILKPGMDTRQVVARFEAERQALALMDHPHIARVFDGGETASGRPYFVMELVKGIPITDFCDQEHLTPRERLRLFADVCQAVQHAHQKGIIHRDIKPSNVLVTLQDGAPLVKVIDFGIAKALGQQLTDKTLSTNFAQMVGTPLYMSPEQAALSNVDVDTRSDIYSLGVLLYELLTGTTPFDKERLSKVGYDELRRILREEEPPKPSTRISTLGQAATTASTQRQTDPKRLSQLCRGELDWIVMKCLDKDRNQRYETASAFAADVQRYLHDEAVLACPPSAGYRIGKFVRRNRPALATAMLVAVAFVVTVLILAVSNSRIRREKNQKEAALNMARQAEALAQEEKSKAQAKAAEAKAVLGFFQEKVLAAARPKEQEGGLGIHATIRAAVDAAQPGIAQSFRDQPLVEAAIRNSLGTTYYYLSEYGLAAEQYERAVALRQSVLGPDHPETLQSRYDWASALSYVTGRLEEAIAIEEETLRLQKTTLGPEHPDTLSSMHNLASGYESFGKRELALPLLTETVEKRRAILGPDHPDTLDSINTLAFIYLEAGQAGKATPLFEQVLAKQKEKFGADHPDTLNTQSHLAAAYRSSGETDKAMALLEQTFQKEKTLLGPDHFATLRTMHELAITYQAAGRLANATVLFEEVLPKAREKLGSDNANTLAAMHGLARAYCEAGRFGEAIALYEQVLDRQKQQLARDHPDRLRTLGNLAFAYQRAGQIDKALPLFEQTLAAQRRKLGTDHPDSLITMEKLAEAYLEAKRFSQAQLILRESLSIRTKSEPGAWTTFNTQSMLGGALLGQKKYADAELPLRQGYQGMKQRAAEIPPSRTSCLTAAVVRLVELYDALGGKAEAAKWRKELEAHQKSAVKNQESKKKN